MPTGTSGETMITTIYGLMPVAALDRVDIVDDDDERRVTAVEYRLRGASGSPIRRSVQIDIKRWPWQRPDAEAGSLA